MKEKNKKYLHSLKVAGNNSSDRESNVGKNTGSDSSKSSIILSSGKSSSGGLDADEKLMKKRKRKITEHSKFNERSENFGYCEKEKTSSHKKKKRLICLDEEQYKPGMLSDFLQKQKYGCLILPWETSFGKDKAESGILPEFGEVKKCEQKIKINPLFNTSKRTGENTLFMQNTTYTVFVGNLPKEITVNQVKKIFKKFSNTINKIKIRSDERKNQKAFTNSTKGVTTDEECKHAIVKFNSQESYANALKMTGKLYNGHHLRITGSKSESSTDPAKSIFVGNLAIGIGDDDLWKTFENCGEIDSVRVIRDKLNKKGTFGYINFKSADSASEALKLDGTSVLEREIRVSRINKNVDSLSNSITVKRNKKKRMKPQLNANNNVSEPNFELETKTRISVKKRKKKKNLSLLTDKKENPEAVV